LDQETVLQQFEILEKKIETLIETCERREAENNELKRQNESLASQLLTLEEAERQSEELKAVVRSKIDSLMGRLSNLTQE